MFVHAILGVKEDLFLLFRFGFLGECNSPVHRVVGFFFFLGFVPFISGAFL